jgi:hypothetical protein
MNLNISSEVSSSRENLKYLEAPWQEIYSKAREFSAYDKEQRQKYAMPSNETIIAGWKETQKKLKVYSEKVWNSVGIKDLASFSSASRELQMSIINTTKEYTARLDYEDKRKLYAEQIKVSTPLMAEFEAYLEKLGTWNYKFTTKFPTDLGRISETAQNDSLYYMAKDASTIRLKRSNLIEGGLAKVIQTPATKAFFVDEEYLKTFNKEIKDKNKFLAPKAKVSVVPILGWHTVEIFTEPFVKYAWGETQTKPNADFGIQRGSIEDLKTHTDNWNISINDPLAFIVGVDPFHFGHGVNSITVS